MRQHFLRHTCGGVTLCWSKQEAPQAPFQAWQLWILLQRLGSPLDYDYRRLYLLPEHPACRRLVDELVSRCMIEIITSIKSMDVTC